MCTCKLKRVHSARDWARPTRTRSATRGAMSGPGLHGRRAPRNVYPASCVPKVPEFSFSHLHLWLLRLEFHAVVNPQDGDRRLGRELELLNLAHGRLDHARC